MQSHCVWPGCPNIAPEFKAYCSQLCCNLDQEYHRKYALADGRYFCNEAMGPPWPDRRLYVTARDDDDPPSPIFERWEQSAQGRNAKEMQHELDNEDGLEKSNPFVKKSRASAHEMQIEPSKPRQSSQAQPSEANDDDDDEGAWIVAKGGGAPKSSSNKRPRTGPDVLSKYKAQSGHQTTMLQFSSKNKKR